MSEMVKTSPSLSSTAGAPRSGHRQPLAVVRAFPAVHLVEAAVPWVRRRRERVGAPRERELELVPQSLRGPTPVTPISPVVGFSLMIGSVNHATGSSA